MGLLTNSQYDGTLDDSRARRLFRRSLFDLANIRHGGAAAMPPSALRKKPGLKRLIA
jgi:hypothetical protein